jgi:hypothetical protein
MMKLKIDVFLVSNSTANPAHLPKNWAKLAKLAALFSW